VSEAIVAGQSFITDENRWNLLQIKAQEVRAARAVSLFRQNSIEPVLIKGVAASTYYPQGKLRACIDVDLAVAERDFTKALEITRSAAADGFAIDLHRELRHLDTVPWNDLFENSRLQQMGDESVRVLRPEDHLRVLIVHWLTNGGTDKDRLWDIYYAVENRREDFDWDRLLGPVSENRRRWIICTLGLAHRFLGLNITNTPVSAEALDLPVWLVKTVEKEWASAVKDQPLETTLEDPRMLLQQVKRRIRPNPIWATVQMEGSFDARTRFFYRAANLVKRVPSSYRRIVDTIKIKHDEPHA
jgi:hypothetical protein